MMRCATSDSLGTGSGSLASRMDATNSAMAPAIPVRARSGTVGSKITFSETQPWDSSRQPR